MPSNDLEARIAGARAKLPPLRASLKVNDQMINDEWDTQFSARPIAGKQSAPAEAKPAPGYAPMHPLMKFTLILVCVAVGLWLIGNIAGAFIVASAIS